MLLWSLKYPDCVTAPADIHLNLSSKCKNKIYHKTYLMFVCFPICSIAEVQDKMCHLSSAFKKKFCCHKNPFLPQCLQTCCLYCPCYWAHLSLFLSGRPLTVFDFMTYLIAERTGAGLVGFKLLSDDGEVGLVGGEAQHDQVSWEKRDVISWWQSCRQSSQTIKQANFWLITFINYLTSIWLILFLI